MLRNGRYLATGCKIITWVNEMIKALQKKFVVTSMIAITILLIVLLGAINTENILVSMNQIEKMVDILVECESNPDSQKLQKLNKENSRSSSEETNSDLLSQPTDEDSRISAIYFTARINANGDIISVRLNRIASISKAEEAQKLAEKALKKNKDTGMVRKFCFKISDALDNGEQVVVFLDTSTYFYTIIRILFFSLFGGTLCWIGMLLLVMILSRKAIRPIAANLERQKQFITDAGHEIKTPLAIIQANTDAMELINGENKWSQNIREQVSRLTSLTQDLLTLARLEENKEPLKMEAFSLTDLAIDSLHSFEVSMLQKQLVVHAAIQPEIMLEANQEQIRRLFSILLDNAVKYSPVGGDIELKLDSVHMTSHGFRKNFGGKKQFLSKTAKNVIIIQMKNTCEKFPQCVPEKLFDRFYRGDSARTQKSGGYGIGLSAASAIVQLHGGKITAAYGKNNEIIFTVCLPRRYKQV